MSEDVLNKGVLIIDDEKDICFLLGTAMQRKKFVVSDASTLQEGMKKLNEMKPALLFLDIRLPDGSGLDALNSIRNSFPEIKIIMMSAYDGPKERAIAEERGADIFIGKPLSDELINETLSKIGII